MYSEDELLPISALQHLAFCERQWALIHLEQAWEENRLTAEGRILHDRADEPETEVRGDLSIARGLRLRSLRLGVVGIADVVEFHKVEKSGIPLEGIGGLWYPTIVEYKRGKPKIGLEDKIQVCAQALCLEEMLNITLDKGYIFYGRPRRRYEVLFSEELREQTESLAIRLHSLTNEGKTPAAEYSKKCERCSLVNLCLPKATGRKGSVEDYLKKVVTNPPQSPLTKGGNNKSSPFGKGVYRGIV